MPPSMLALPSSFPLVLHARALRYRLTVSPQPQFRRTGSGGNPERIHWERVCSLCRCSHCSPCFFPPTPSFSSVFSPRRALCWGLSPSCRRVAHLLGLAQGRCTDIPAGRRPSSPATVVARGAFRAPAMQLLIFPLLRAWMRTSTRGRVHAQLSARGDETKQPQVDQALGPSAVALPSRCPWALIQGTSL